jgi:hypothetical protein
MKNAMQGRLLILVSVLLFSAEALAGQKGRKAKRRAPIAIERDYSERRKACASNQFLVSDCVNQEIDVENCIMRFANSECCGGELHLRACAAMET